MSKIKYGQLLVIEEGETLLTGINVDNFKHTVDFIFQRGGNVQKVELPMETVISTGILNLKPLETLAEIAFE